MSKACAPAWFTGVVLCFVFAFASALQAQGGPPRDFKFTELELKLLDESNEFDRLLIKKGLVYQDPELDGYLEEITKRMLGDQASPERVQFKLHVLRDPMVNAFALPNGSIYVNTGLLAAMEDEAELASVLAHEVTHVINRHTYQHNRSTRKKMVTMHVLSAVAAAGGYFPAGSVFGATLSVAGSLGEVMVATTIFGYSQDLERDADRNGMALLVGANYDPRAMVRTFERLDEKLEFEPVDTFWRTHPKLQERRQTALTFAEAHSAKSPRPTTESDYLTRVARAVFYNVQADLRSRRARTALARTQRLIRWKPDDPAYQVLAADAYRALGGKTAEPTDLELTDKGQAEDRKRFFKRTEEEEQKELLAKAGGPEERLKNRDRAAKIYRETIARDPLVADAHRGLGFLFEEDGKSSEAAAEYRKYLELAPPDAMDRLRIQRRMESLEKSALPAPSASPVPAAD